MLKLFILAILFQGAATFAAPLPKLSADEIARRLQKLQYPAYRSGAITKVDFTDDCGVTFNTVLPFTDPESKVTKKFIFTITLPFANAPVPLVIGVPTIMGPTILENRLDALFCRENIAYVLVDAGPYEYDITKDGLRKMDESARMEVKAIRQFLDYVQTSPYQTNSAISKFDFNNIGVLGLSHGTYSAALLAAVDKRIKATVIMGAIGNVPYTVTHSTDSRVSDFRSKQMTAQGITDPTAFEMHLRKFTSLNPVDVASLIKPDSIFQVLIEGDTAVPFVVQKELWDSLNHPAHAVTKGMSHAEAIIHTVYMDPDLLMDFLRKKLVKRR